MSDRADVVSLAVLSDANLSGVGGSLKHVYRLAGDHDFDQLLADIDHADRVCRSGATIADAVPPVIAPES